MRRLALVVLLTLGFAPAEGGPGYADVRIEGVPHEQQQPDFCGEACAAMYLRKLGRPVSQGQVFAAAGVDPALGRGAYTDELARALRALGFDPGPVWSHPADRAGVEAAWRALHEDLVRGVPSIVCMHYDEAPGTTEHFRLVLGYDASRDEVLFHEPAEADGAYRRMSRERFLRLWTFKPRPDRQTLIRLRLEAVAAPAPPAEGRPSAAELAQHVLELKKTLPAGFTVAVQAPFVVVGDEAPAKVRERAERRVRWTRDLLLKDFFPAAPPEITEVWIFRDKRSYEHHARALFHEEPTTPYGFYLEDRRALLMNIAPGDGTLVHELVHPFVHANAPEAPAWLNEGLASLYERPGEEGGHLRGYSNWRLPSLRAALADGALPPLPRLLRLSERAFYDDDDGTHYAFARYLCFYLQEKGLLRRFVARYLAARAQDPTGERTLLEVLGQRDWAPVEADFRRMVRSL